MGVRWVQRRGWRAWELQADGRLNPKSRGNYKLYIMRFIVSAFSFDGHKVILCQMGFFFLHLGFRLESDKYQPCWILENKVKIFCVPISIDKRGLRTPNS